MDKNATDRLGRAATTLTKVADLLEATFLDLSWDEPGEEAPAAVSGPVAQVTAGVRKMGQDVEKMRGVLARARHIHMAGVDRLAGASARLLPAQRVKLNRELISAGLDGNFLFQKATKGLAKAFDVLAKAGIEPDEVVSSYHFMREDGRTTVNLAFTNPEDSFSPVVISNSMLALTWHKVAEDKYEVIAYLS
jgi:hypothetical protein